jgi:hypothetical protein
MAPRTTETTHPPATTQPETPTTVHRVLVIANETVGARGLLNEIGRRSTGASEIRVIAPALVNSRLKFALADVDEARVKARDRLEKSLAALRRLGLQATGEVGDADPNLAIEDALRTFPADDVIISTHPPERSTWLENEVVERARRELNLPVTHVVVDLEAEAEEDKVRLLERVQPSAKDERAEEAESQADYLPPMPMRDRITLVVGIVGTIVLGILTLLCPDNGNFGGGCAVRLAIFGAAFFITLWHSVAILVMDSVRYRGALKDLVADMVLYGIPPAILLSALFG